MLIDVAIDVAIKNDLNKLRGKSRAQQTNKENQQERLGNWKERLGKVTATTKNKLETTLEKLGPAGNKLVSSLTKGSEYIKSQTSNKAVKIFAAAGLVSAGALAAYATPVVLASMAGVGLGLRVVSAAKVYAFSRKLLDEKYKIWEKEGTKKSTLSVAGYETAAIGFALFAGEAVGKAFEIIASSEVVHEVVTSIKNTANLGSVTEAWGNLFNKETLTAVASDTQSVASTSTASSPSTTHEVAPPSQSSQLENTVTPPNPELQHVVKKGDSLWSLLRKDLADMNLEGFEKLSQGAKERMMREILDNTSVPSGNIDKIYPGDTVDFNKVDFKAYLARYLDK